MVATQFDVVDVKSPFPWTMVAARSRTDRPVVLRPLDADPRADVPAVLGSRPPGPS